MSLGDNFNITVHANNVTNTKEFTPYIIEYSNIAGRASLVGADRDEAKLLEENKPLSRIDLKHYFNTSAIAKIPGDNNYESGTTMATALHVKESLTEIQELIDSAQAGHIKKLHKLRVSVM